MFLAKDWGKMFPSSNNAVFMSFTPLEEGCVPAIAFPMQSIRSVKDQDILLVTALAQ